MREHAPPRSRTTPAIVSKPIERVQPPAHRETTTSLPTPRETEEPPNFPSPQQRCAESRNAWLARLGYPLSINETLQPKDSQSSPAPAGRAQETPALRSRVRGCSRDRPPGRCRIRRRVRPAPCDVPPESSRAVQS